MTSSTATPSHNSSYDATFRTVSGETDIRELGHELWTYFAGNAATIEYSLDNITVGVPRTTGPDSPRATWRLQGTIRIHTSDDDAPGALSS